MQSYEDDFYVNEETLRSVKFWFRKPICIIEQIGYNFVVSLSAMIMQW